MTTQKTIIPLHYYSCECLVNSKIPTTLFTKLETRLRRHLQSQNNSCASDAKDQLKLLEGDEVLAATIESLQITEELNPYNSHNPHNSQIQNTMDSSTDYSNDSINNGVSNVSNVFKVFLYKYPESPSTTTGTRTINLTTQDPDSNPDTSTFYSSELFPCPRYQGLWESLEFDSAVKDSCLAYLTAVFKFTLKGMAESNEVTFNRILLLHGPPGTGKL